ncbi:hypothetical protein ACIN5110_0738 [Acinetobacter baumannii OIFC110]|nr:hypothetical protein ACIN5110_0738 [Acinetobacter baumannii OIFC110]
MTATDLANGYITAALDATAADPVTGQIVIHAEAVDAKVTSMLRCRCN